MTDPAPLIFYHYRASPYAGKVVQYMELRNIPYLQCNQLPYPPSPKAPRPDLAAIGVNYRRIPVLAHGNDVFCDTRAILAHLDAAFPPSTDHPGLTPTDTHDRAYAMLLEKWAIEGGVFGAAAMSLPVDLPMIADPKFQQDRQALFPGSSWKREDMLRNQASGLAAMREAFYLLEEQVLGDGRAWVLGGSESGGPSRADLDAVWPFQWLAGIPKALPERSISPAQFPKAFAWIKRFNDAVKAARARRDGKRAPEVSGEEAAKLVLESRPVVDVQVDESDPTGFRQGQLVESRPTDYGASHKDSGEVVGLTAHELVMLAKAPGDKTVRIHYPRSGFKIRSLDESKL